MTENKKTKHLISKRDSNLDAYIVLGIFSLISIFPLYMMLVSSTNTISGAEYYYDLFDRTHDIRFLFQTLNYFQKHHP